ncbi:MAG: hypothetical protein KDC69_01880 [Flavobacteriaceae bacterium]|nr:hypothetical protein [Flavobacteriaceae bacterium]
MAIMVLLSTFSFMVDMHYCGDNLVDVAIFSKAETCGMEAQTTTTTSDCNMTKKNCCHEEQLLVKGQHELNNNVQKLPFSEQVFLTAFFVSYVELFEGLEEQVIPYRNYKPPLIISDLRVLHQVFRI